MNRCDCTGHSFAELMTLGAEWDYDPACVAVLTGAGTRCGRCRDALEEALRQAHAQETAKTNAARRRHGNSG